MRPGKDVHERGEANPQSKLSAPQVFACLALREHGHSYRQIAQRFGVSESCVCDVCKGKTWSWLTQIVYTRSYRPSRRRRIMSAPGQLTLF